MKTLEKNQMKNVKGGSLSCMSHADSQTSSCIWSDGGKICVGVYTWGGTTKSLKCTDGVYHDMMN